MSVRRATLRARAGRLAADFLTSWGSSRVVGRSLERVQVARDRIEEIEGAFLHFWLLPSREDLRTLRRRVHRVRKEVRALETEVGRLEAMVEGDARP